MSMKKYQYQYTYEIIPMPMKYYQYLRNKTNAYEILTLPR